MALMKAREEERFNAAGAEKTNGKDAAQKAGGRYEFNCNGWRSEDRRYKVEINSTTSPCGRRLR
jgi:hypothetical protein